MPKLPLIFKDPTSGKARVAGTNLCVWSIVNDLGTNPLPMDVAEYARDLRVDSIHIRAALRYYDQNKAEIDDLIALNR